MSALLEARGLRAQYGDFHALGDVSFRVEPSEIVSIVGANGAGKTTTLKAVIGIVRPSGGSVHVDGDDVTGAPPSSIVARGIALVPEGRNLFRDMTVDENLHVGAHTCRDGAEARARAAEMYERFPMLPPLRARYAGSLSGGQQQMVAIARALMSRPRVLLMDEPSLGLSPKITFEVFAMVRAISDAGVAVVLVEQNVAQALGLAQRAYVMAEGRTVMDGSAADMIAHPDVKRRYLGEL